ncbi:zinc-dependent metalloprotease [Flagellimonas olearia]|uniref:DUF5117 domain-containing protein n=1 Tax=Flagellimonas olearia TaxID=552546 RepID=A0A444VHW3_9FLAO|nr:zinc-dependent metalloprotease [Allomuricauda olearia]RYC50356.1 hypothetical protein DN53_05375 [Allomuricauda olearia]
MKVIKIMFWISSIALGRKRTVHRALALSALLLGVACPLWGQANNGIGAYLEDNRLFLVLDREIIGEPMLFVRHHKGQLMVRWLHLGEQVVLTQHRVRSTLGEWIPIDDDYKIEERVLGKFKIIKDKNDTGGLTIDATELILSNDMKWFAYDSPERIDLRKSYIYKVEKLDGETVIRTKRTTNTGTTSKTIEVDFSFYQLTDWPMRPRLFDHRMGYYLEDVWDAQRTDNYKAAIMRWRMEKKDPMSTLSEPVIPITFYFHPDVPDLWKPYIRAGILAWSVPFEAAGFKNAIKVRDLPEGAPSGHSVTYSMIRWENFSGVRGSEKESGSTAKMIVDQRTGEILKADILISSSPRSLVDEYVVRCAPMDARAQRYPVPESLVGELFQYVTSHETGHALGLMDGNYGEYAYPLEKIRDVQWLRKMGHTPSIMNYARHNYIAQPEDSIPASLLLQKVGPMDIFQIKWGYSNFPKVTSPFEERPILDSIILAYDSIPWYRFNADRYGRIGPGNTHEAVDNRDPITSTELGLRNMEKVMGLLPKLNRDQPDDALLKRLYKKTLELWFYEMRHVLSLVGGYTIHYKSAAQPGAVYVPISMGEQRKALGFLLQNAFEVPQWLEHPSFEYRLDDINGTDMLLVYQLQLLSELMGVSRMGRLEHMERAVLWGMISMLQEGLFQELKDIRADISPRRQEIQSTYIDTLINIVKRKEASFRVEDKKFDYTDYSKGLLMQQLISLKKDIKKAVKKNKESSSLGHWQICLNKLNAIQ